MEYSKNQLTANYLHWKSLCLCKSSNTNYMFRLFLNCSWQKKKIEKYFLKWKSSQISQFCWVFLGSRDVLPVLEDTEFEIQKFSASEHYGCGRFRPKAHYWQILLIGVSSLGEAGTGRQILQKIIEKIGHQTVHQWCWLHRARSQD